MRRFLKGMTPIKRLLLLNAVAGGENLTELTETGNPATFSTDVAKALTGLTIPFEPYQSGTGDPSPENIRPVLGWNRVTIVQAGKNLFDKSTQLVTNSYIRAGNTTAEKPLGEVGSNSSFSCTDYIKVNPQTEYTATTPYYSSANAAGLVFFADKSVESAISGTNLYAQGSATYTFTTPATCKYIRFSWGNNNGNDSQLELGSASTYKPYTGTSYPVTFPVLGKNLLKITATSKEQEGVTYTVNGDTITVSGTATGYSSLVCGSVPLEGMEKITVSGLVGSTNINWNCVLRDADNATIGTVGSGDSDFTFDASEYPTAAKLEVQIKRNNNVATSGTLHIQVEKGSSATAYEPYTTTAYGGTLDLTTGVLTVTMAIKTYDGSNDEEIRYSTSADNLNFYTIKEVLLPSVQSNRDQVKRCICDKLVGCSGAIVSDSQTRASGQIAVITNNRFYILMGNNEVEANATAFREWLDENNITICYELATPLTYQLTPQQITSLIGDNTIWSDANGDLTVKYLKKVTS